MGGFHPCPLCGSKVDARYTDIPDGQTSMPSFVVTCLNLDCRCEMSVAHQLVYPLREDEMEGIARERWNRRHAPEGWQCVPVEMTPDMGEAVKGYNRFIDWKEALAAAPKPGGE